MTDSELIDYVKSENLITFNGYELKKRLGETNNNIFMQLNRMYLKGRLEAGNGGYGRFYFLKRN